MSEPEHQRHAIAVGFLHEECERLMADIAGFESGTVRLQHRDTGGAWVDTSAKRVAKLRRLLESRREAIAAHQRDMELA